MNELIKVIISSIEVKAFDASEPLDRSLFIKLMESFISKENDNCDIKSHAEALAEIIKSNALIHITKEYGGKIKEKWSELVDEETNCSYFLEMNDFHCQLKNELLSRFNDPHKYGGLLNGGCEKLQETLGQVSFLLMKLTQCTMIILISF